MKKLIAIAWVLGMATVCFGSTNPEMVKKPQPLNLAEVARSATYPTSSNLNAVEGTVMMLVSIDANGQVAGHQALSFPCEALKKSAEEAVEKLQFVPAQDASGNAIASAVRIPFHFELTID